MWAHMMGESHYYTNMSRYVIRVLSIVLLFTMILLLFREIEVWWVVLI